MEITYLNACSNNVSDCTWRVRKRRIPEKRLTRLVRFDWRPDMAGFAIAPPERRPLAIDRRSSGGSRIAPALSKNCQSACKPGSVRRGVASARDGHSSGTVVANRLKQPTRATSRKPAGALRLLSPLFGLAPGGACHAAPVTGRAVRSYRTFSPLPAPRERGRAVRSLWRYPWGRPRRTLSGAVFPWSPDFPPGERIRRAAVQPTGLGGIGAASRGVKRVPTATQFMIRAP